MNCEKCLENLSPYIDHALASSEGDAVKNHLAQCPACQEAYMQLVQIVAKVGNMGEVTVPKGLHEAVMMQIQAEQVQQQKTVGQGKVVPLRLRKWVYWAGGAAAALIIGMTWLLQPQDQMSVPTPVAMSEQKGRSVPTTIGDETQGKIGGMVAESAPMSVELPEEWVVTTNDLQALMHMLEEQEYQIQETHSSEGIQITINQVDDKMRLEKELEALKVKIDAKNPSDMQSVTLFIKK